jgi:poly(3-hydroxybutyrate) depolymerase
MQTDYIQPGVGHYGVFHGARFETEIAPRVTQFTRRFTRRPADEAAAAAKKL